jgi:hypothetical protein
MFLRVLKLVVACQWRSGIPADYLSSRLFAKFISNLNQLLPALATGELARRASTPGNRGWRLQRRIRLLTPPKAPEADDRSPAGTGQRGLHSTRRCPRPLHTT